MRNEIKAAVSILLGVTTLTGLGVAQTDGITTFNPVPTAAIPTYPALPGNSGDIVYDSGDYTGHSRNLQNADIHPGWPYYAHQVRFTPAPNMQGELLEVRYVAAVQWGTTANFDLVIRDASGAILASMPGLTATIDSNNWQVIDVSALDFVPASNPGDFYVELQPSSQCNGTNGFTIAWSDPGSGHSAFSADCTNPFASFAGESRDLFIRSVVELMPTGAPGSAYCFGDGTGSPCPCVAFGGVGEGCLNTGGTGATLSAAGIAAFSNDTLSFSVVGVPGAKPGLILRGDNQIASPAGDGILCAAGGSMRSHVQVTVAGATTFNDFAGNPFGVVANTGAPTNFQFWYRDPSNTCSGAGFNFTNGWTVTYTP